MVRNTKYITITIKFIIAWATCLIIRLIPFRPPNIEPLMATQMPFAKSYGSVCAYAFGFFSILLFDIILGKVGLWTVITAVTYGFVGVAAAWFFNKFKKTPFGFVKYAIIGTLFYDGLTGLTIGPLMFHQSFMEALIGQIPFTLNHLLGNIFLSLTLSPLVYRWIVVNENLNFEIFRKKIINI